MAVFFSCFFVRETILRTKKQAGRWVLKQPAYWKKLTKNDLDIISKGRFLPAKHLSSENKT